MKFWSQAQVVREKVWSWQKFQINIFFNYFLLVPNGKQVSEQCSGSTDSWSTGPLVETAKKRGKKCNQVKNSSVTYYTLHSKQGSSKNVECKTKPSLEVAEQPDFQQYSTVVPAGPAPSPHIQDSGPIEYMDLLASSPSHPCPLECDWMILGCCQ